MCLKLQLNSTERNFRSNFEALSICALTTSQIRALGKLFECNEWKPLDAFSFESIYLRTWFSCIGKMPNTRRKALEADLLFILSPDLSLNCTTFVNLCRAKMFVEEEKTIQTCSAALNKLSLYLTLSSWWLISSQILCDLLFYRCRLIWHYVDFLCVNKWNSRDSDTF